MSNSQTVRSKIRDSYITTLIFLYIRTGVPRICLTTGGYTCNVSYREMYIHIIYR